MGPNLGAPGQSRDNPEIPVKSAFRKFRCSRPVFPVPQDVVGVRAESKVARFCHQSPPGQSTLTRTKLAP